MTPFAPVAAAEKFASDAAAAVAHAAEDARALKTAAAEAVEDGREAVKRAYDAGRKRLAAASRLPSDAADCIAEQPLTAVGVALGAGLLIGAAFGWVARSTRR
jgi:ElaB/YqjD/DUF883 family membrane-anchored ribosome-binding protein